MRCAKYCCGVVRVSIVKRPFYDTPGEFNEDLRKWTEQDEEGEE